MLGPATDVHKAGVKGYLIIAAALTAAAAILSGVYDTHAQLNWVSGALVLAVLVLVLALIVWILSLRVSFHERGISVRSFAHQKEMLWEDVDQLHYKAKRQEIKNIPILTMYKFRLRGGGKTISFAGWLVSGMRKAGAIGQKLIQNTSAPLLEKMRAQYQNGGTLALGPLRFSQTDGICWAKYLHHLPFPLSRLPSMFGEDRLPLSEFAESKFAGGHLCLTKAGELRPRVRFAVSKVPNGFVLKDLLNEVRPAHEALPEAKRGLSARTGNRLKRMVASGANRFEGKLLFLLLASVVAGPGAAYLGWSNGQMHQDVNSRGIETIASIEGARKSTWKHVDMYSLSLA